MAIEDSLEAVCKMLLPRQPHTIQHRVQLDATLVLSYGLSMIIWSGLGILIPLVYVLSMGGVMTIQEPLGIPDNWSMFLSVLLGTALNWGISMTSAKTQRYTLMDPQTRQVHEIVKRHTLFFMPYRFWCWLGIPLTLVGLLVALSPDEQPRTRKAGAPTEAVAR